LQILQAYAERDPRVRVISQENGGMSNARNTGMDAARGKYISFIDSDDFIAPDMLERLYNRAEQAQAELVICNLMLYFEDTGKYGYYRDEVLYYQLKNRVFDLEQAPEMVACIAVWDRLYLRSFLQESGVRFIEGMIYEDVPFTVETVLKARRMAVVPDHLYYYRKARDQSITGQESRRGVKHRSDFIEIHRYTQRVLRESGCSDAVFSAHLDHFIGQAMMHNAYCDTRRQYREFFAETRALFDGRMYALCAQLKDAGKRDFARHLEADDPTGARRVLCQVFPGAIRH
ncbi:glycosyltransferase, partial [Luoshenia tenuis]|uniref:glycosyltransferase n=1 Tax=Luoshenia tenuis TaxID=2763654 RepID=UPI003D8C5BA1